MLLAIDISNTNTKLGLLDGDELVAHWRISTVWERTADEYRVLLRGLLSDVVPHDAAIAAVVPSALAAMRTALEEVVPGDVFVVGSGIKTGMPIAVDNPREVGADRVVNSVGVAEHYGTPAVVVDFGTATTFDVVDEQGRYVGGAIAPGLEVSLDALVHSTAALRRVELVVPERVVGKSTVEAIQSGLLYGYAGLVDGIMHRILEEHPDAVTLGTGGLAATVVPLCETVDEIDDLITLKGLKIIYDRNRA